MRPLEVEPYRGRHRRVHPVAAVRPADPVDGEPPADGVTGTGAPTDGGSGVGPSADPTIDPTEVGVSPAAAVRLLIVHLKPMRLPLLCGLLLLTVATVVGLALPLAARHVLESIAGATPLGNAVLILVAVVAASALSQGAGNFLLLRSVEDVVQASRKRLVDRLLSLSLSGMSSQAPGDLMARVTSDTALIRVIATASIVPFVVGLITIAGAIVVMVVLDGYLFLVTFGVIAVPTVVLSLTMPRVRRAAQETQRNVGAMGSELERVLGDFSAVKVAAAEDVESERLGNRTMRARDSGVRTAFWSAVAVMTSGLAVQAAFLVVLGVGGYRVQTGTLTVATLIAFLLYAMQLSQPVLQLTQAISSFQAGRAALERIAEVDRMEREAPSGTVGAPEDAIGEPAPVPDRAPGGRGSHAAVDWTTAVEFVDVSFSYRGSPVPAVSHFSLRIPRTGVTAIVGPSGSGKSSVLKLVEGLFPLDSGTVAVAGRDLTEWDLGKLRRVVALVEQETPVQAGSLRENLTYGVRDVDDRTALDALCRVGLESRFRSVADLDAEVGHRGETFSGGERQRIAIARALLRRPTVLLLDEATSQLDAANESIMRRVVAHMGTRAAVVIVAHRLSTVVDADQIVLMENGRVRNVGTHTTLLRTDRLYRGMVDEQSLEAMSSPAERRHTPTSAPAAPPSRGTAGGLTDRGRLRTHLPRGGP